MRSWLSSFLRPWISAVVPGDAAITLMSLWTTITAKLRLLIDAALAFVTPAVS